MLQSFTMGLLAGFEAFLIVGIVLAYLKQSGHRSLAPPTYWALATSALLSGATGYLVAYGVNADLLITTFGEPIGGWIIYFINNESSREGFLGSVTIILAGPVTVQVWRTAQRLKTSITQPHGATSPRYVAVASAGTFLFFTVVITRETMGVAAFLWQVGSVHLVTGTILGLTAAGMVAAAWVRFGTLINPKRFLQVSIIFLLLFLAQIAIYTFHEFTEAGLFVASETLHGTSEPFSPDGIYGKWFSLVIVSACALVPVGGWTIERFRIRLNAIWGEYEKNPGISAAECNPNSGR